MDDKRIETNKDKVKLALIEYKEVKQLSTNILTNFIFLVTLAITLFTTNFKDYLGIPSSTIEVFVWLLLVVFFVITVKLSIQMIYYKYKKKDTVERFIADLEGIDYDAKLNEEKKARLKSKDNFDTSGFWEFIRAFFRWIFQIVFYLLPLGLMIGLPFLFSFLNTISDLEILWFFYFWIVIGCLYSYILMFQYWSDISEWFENLFDGYYF